MIVWRSQEKIATNRYNLFQYNLNENIKLAIDTSYRAAI